MQSDYYFTYYKGPFTRKTFEFSVAAKKKAEIEYMHFYGSVHTSNFLWRQQKNCEQLRTGPFSDNTMFRPIDNISLLRFFVAATDN